jgi:hypothetical protein
LHFYIIFYPLKSISRINSEVPPISTTTTTTTIDPFSFWNLTFRHKSTGNTFPVQYVQYEEWQTSLQLHGKQAGLQKLVEFVAWLWFQAK